MANAGNNNYKPINSDYESDKREQLKQEDIYAKNPNTNSAYTNTEMEQQIAEANKNGANIDVGGMNTYSQLGGYTQDRNEAISNGGTGETVPFYKEGDWYSYDGKDRPVKEGDSGADEHFLSDADYAYVQYCKQMYAKAPTAEERAYWHAEAEKVRARYDYAGGTDGSGYYTLGSLGAAGKTGGNGGMGANGGAGAGGTTGAATESDLKSLLDAWQQAALQQSNAQNDYAVQQAVAELERALADAQPQFKEQAESVDRDARQAMDNSALYAELRGDKGGIGQEQYNAIQNTQAQNHLSVQQAQTKLATDTQRQIADLRAQGEFEKADAALQITQQYLAQLISLEQWAAEYNLSVEQFNESIRQWEAEYNMAMQQLQISQNQWQAEFDYTQQLNSQNQLAAMGEALLSAGIPLTDEQLKAMGITGEQASQLLIQQQLAAAQKGSGVSGDFISNLNALYAAAQASGSPEVYLENMYKAYGLTNKAGLLDGYNAWINQGKASEKDPNGDGIADASVSALGLGNIGFSALEDMVEQGILEMDTNELGLIVVRWANGWSAAKYKNHTLY